MRISFTRSSSSIPSWEDNDWLRNHGYQSPFDNYLILQWIACITVDLGFFGFLYHFVNGDPVMDNTRALVSAWNPELSTNTLLYTPRWPWSWQISFFHSCVCAYLLLGSDIVIFVNDQSFSIGVKLLSIITSFVSTEEPIVARQRNQVPRSKTYVRRYGIPVVDSMTNVCGICRIKVPKSTRHCKLCNKCVAGMDHHCRWLNCCIGQSNYKLFMTLITLALSALVWYTALATTTLWMSTYRINVFAGHALELLMHVTGPVLDDPGTIQANYSVSLAYYLSLVIAVLLAILSIIGAVAMLRLFLFHLRLVYLNMTTVEYINRSGRHSSYDDDDDEDDDDEFDDYYYDDEEEDEDDLDDWKKLWSPVGSGMSATKSSIGSHYAVKAWRIMRRVTYRIQRPWRRCMPRSFRYRRLGQKRYSALWCDQDRNRRRSNDRRRRRRVATNQLPLSRGNQNDDMYMEELLATQTIRPVLVDGEEQEGPDYNDDMGLDMSILDEKFSPATPVAAPKRSSKAARILDISDEEAMRYQQSHQAQRLQEQLIKKGSSEDRDV